MDELTWGLFFSVLIFCAFVALGQWRLSRERAFLYYVGYLMATACHYLRNFWLVKAFEGRLPFPPDLPMKWDAPMSYAATVFYILFIERAIGAAEKAPLLSKYLHLVARFLAVCIGLYLTVVFFLGREMAERFHSALLLAIGPLMFWALAKFVRLADRPYQKFIVAGNLMVVLGVLQVLFFRIFPADNYPNAFTCAYIGPFGKFYWPHIRAWLMLEVLLFSWAMTLWQRHLLAGQSRVVRVREVVAPTSPAPGGPVDDPFLENLKGFLKENIHRETLTVGEVARAVFLSESQTARKLRDRTGLTTEQFVLRFRLERAAKLLASTEMAVGEVAASVGMKDTAHFSNSFKKAYGQSPTHFRRTSREKAG